MKRSLHILEHPPSAECHGCGECCKRYPGIASPQDFGAPDRKAMVDRIATALASGKWAIDAWDQDSFMKYTEFIRPATVIGRPIRDYTYGGACVMLGPAGCTLEPAARPRQCRALRPRTLPHLPCLPDDERTDGKLGSVRRWSRFQAVIRAAEQRVERGTKA